MTPTPPPAVTPAPLAPVRLERVWSWLDIEVPTYITEIPDGSSRMAVVSQQGYVLVLTGSPEAATGTQTVLLDIRPRVLRSGSEEGLLGLAFHPEFAENGRMFVNYSAGPPRRSVVSEFKVTPGGTADAASERILMTVDQPYANHNGGMLGFGPDGYLYIAFGDGGSSGDPHGNGQNTGVLLGKVLRVDVDTTTTGRQYAIPTDNPFAGGGGAPEVWAYGLRNPWRFSWDRVTGEMWAGDVGQNWVEEVDIIRGGANYGWNVMEGDDCYNPRTNCSDSGLTLPVMTYTHGSSQTHCSVTGGYVYRGNRMASLYGAYLYGDYCSGYIWALRWDGQQVTEHLQVASSGLRISSFGESLDGEVFIVDHGGRIFRFGPG